MCTVIDGVHKMANMLVLMNKFMNNNGNGEDKETDKESRDN